MSARPDDRDRLETPALPMWPGCRPRADPVPCLRVLARVEGSDHIVVARRHRVRWLTPHDASHEGKDAAWHLHECALSAYACVRASGQRRRPDVSCRGVRACVGSCCYGWCDAGGMPSRFACSRIAALWACAALAMLSKPLKDEALRPHPPHIGGGPA